ncbi:MAG: flagellar biosynthesis protein FlaG [Tindallia sp. MSAO_Bac2]|nr:MAG: flagellar biosynthesis protein FlaG [Tindallia sp. MSAO_Bac2]
MDRVQSSQASERVSERQGSRVAGMERNQALDNKESGKTQQERMQRTMEKGNNVEDFQDALDQANKSFEPLNRHFEFSPHDKLNRVMVKVIDTNTEEVIREIPPEKLVDMVANMLEVAGILVDERG